MESTSELSELTALRARVRQLEDELAKSRAVPAEEAELLKLICDSLNVVLFIDEPGLTKQLYVSPAYETIWGAPADELYGDPASWMKYIHPSDRQRINEAVEKVKKEPGPFAERYRIIRPDGQLRWIDDRSIPVFDESGAVYRICGYCIDITEQEANQRMLRQFEKLKAYEQLGESLKIALWIMSADLRKIIYLSPMWEKFYGNDVEEIKKDPFHFLDYVHPLDRQRLHEATLNELDNPGHLDEQYRVILPDGSMRWFWSRSFAPETDRGNIQEIWGLIEDITDRKTVEENAKYLELMSQREDFMAALTHDLKTPLIGANRILELITRGTLGPLTERQMDVLQQLARSNRDLLSMVQNLLEVYRFERDANQLQFGPVSLKELIASSIADFQALIAERKIKLILHAPDEVMLDADAMSIKRLVQNLLDNAVKFTPESGRIVVQLFEGTSNVIIEIEDSGPGIPADEREGMFERFWQGTSGKKYSPGIGLGLYLCRQIVEAHGGKIVYLEREGAGAIFSVRLPIMHAVQVARKMR